MQKSAEELRYMMSKTRHGNYKMFSAKTGMPLDFVAMVWETKIKEEQYSKILHISTIRFVEQLIPEGGLDVFNIYKYENRNWNNEQDRVIEVCTGCRILSVGGIVRCENFDANYKDFGYIYMISADDIWAEYSEKIDLVKEGINCGEENLWFELLERKVISWDLLGGIE